MICLMRKSFVILFTLVFSFNLIARDSTLLNSGWRFQSGDVTNAAQVDFDDSGWQAISISHD